MEDLIFHDGELPVGYQAFQPHTLFNHRKHLELQASQGWMSFYILNKKLKRALALIHFHVENNVARSPLRGPFGSIEMDEVSNVTLFNFLEFITSRLKEIGISKIEIKNPNDIYQQNFASMLHTFFFNLGYQVSNAEVSAVITVTNEPFNHHLDSWEKRKLRQSHEAGLRFEKCPVENLSDVYLFILTCRKQRGYSLSMSLAQLKQTVDLFPDHYMLFCVKDGDKLAAASIAIKVNENIMYNFYSAHPNEYNAFSPVVMLMEGMYAYCKENKFKYLDLGTSAVDGKPNFNLLDFKLRLGAKPYSKLTFEKTW